MLIHELLESGLIEMYCLGIASDEDKRLIEQLAKTNKLVRNEIASVQEAIRTYSETEKRKLPHQSVKRKILDTIASDEATELGLPPILSQESNIEDWLAFLRAYSIYPNKNFPDLYMKGLPSSLNLITCIIYAKKNTVVEEIHPDELERILMLQGACTITCNGISKAYKAGDYIEIMPDTLHIAKVTSDEVMILVSQRLAA